MRRRKVVHHVQPHHINVIYHWFWQHIVEDTGLEIAKNDTTEQLADIATKALEITTYEKIRKLLTSHSQCRSLMQSFCPIFCP